MFLQQPARWSIRSDFPEALQFCAYIGQQRGFALDGEARSAVEQAWREWWQVCSSTTLTTLNAAYEREHPGDGEALQYIGTHYRQVYDPPAFAMSAITNYRRFVQHCGLHSKSFGAVATAQKAITRSA